SPGEKPAGAFDGRGFVVTQAMTSLTGSAGEDFASVLRALGYRMDRRPPLPPKPVVVETPAAEAVAAEGIAETVSGETVLADAAPTEAAAETLTQDNTPPEAAAAEPTPTVEPAAVVEATGTPPASEAADAPSIS